MSISVRKSYQVFDYYVLTKIKPQVLIEIIQIKFKKINNKYKK